MAALPNILLLGYGVLDSLQLTVETQAVLTRYGRAYSLGLPPNLARHLKSQRVKVTDLSDRLAPERPFAEAYLDVANFIFERAAAEIPVIFLAPGNPLATNAIGRYLAMEGPERGLTVQAIPGVSQLDLILSATALDVSTFGLQVFDATKLVARAHAVNTAVPLLLLHAGGFGLEAVPRAGGTIDLQPLAKYLCRYYPAEHPVVVIDVVMSPSAVAMTGTPLGRLGGASASIGAGAALFLDAIRATPAERRPDETPSGADPP